MVTWAFYKPSRVLAPELNGVSCVSDFICLEDKSHLKEAKFLYDEAFEFVNSNIDQIKKKPRVIFCSSEPCFQSFGFNKSSSHTVGTSGIIISPRGWKNYYIRHEMIHHLQAERLGILKYQFAHTWFIEGMAYSLSNDPRSNLPKPFDHYRSEFDKWHKSVDKENFWIEVQKLK